MAETSAIPEAKSDIADAARAVLAGSEDDTGRSQVDDGTQIEDDISRNQVFDGTSIDGERANSSGAYLQARKPFEKYCVTSTKNGRMFSEDMETCMGSISPLKTISAGIGLGFRYLEAGFPNNQNFYSLSPLGINLSLSNAPFYTVLSNLGMFRFSTEVSFWQDDKAKSSYKLRGGLFDGSLLVPIGASEYLELSPCIACHLNNPYREDMTPFGLGARFAYQLSGDRLSRFREMEEGKDMLPRIADILLLMVGASGNVDVRTGSVSSKFSIGPSVDILLDGTKHFESSVARYDLGVNFHPTQNAAYISVSGAYYWQLSSAFNVYIGGHLGHLVNLGPSRDQNFPISQTDFGINVGMGMSGFNSAAVRGE